MPTEHILSNRYKGTICAPKATKEALYQEGVRGFCPFHRKVSHMLPTALKTLRKLTNDSLFIFRTVVAKNWVLRNQQCVKPEQETSLLKSLEEHSHNHTTSKLKVQSLWKRVWGGYHDGS
jgi:hypothetical protein